MFSNSEKFISEKIDSLIPLDYADEDRGLTNKLSKDQWLEYLNKIKDYLDQETRDPETFLRSLFRIKFSMQNLNLEAFMYATDLYFGFKLTSEDLETVAHKLEDLATFLETYFSVDCGFDPNMYQVSYTKERTIRQETSLHITRIRQDQADLLKTAKQVWCSTKFGLGDLDDELDDDLDDSFYES